MKTSKELLERDLPLLINEIFYARKIEETVNFNSGTVLEEIENQTTEIVNQLKGKVKIGDIYYKINVDFELDIKDIKEKVTEISAT